MNLQQLRYIVEVEKTSSITQAAKNLFMGQPNLSKALKELEGEIGITIFERTPKGVVPTHDGHIFLRSATSILSQVNALENFYKVTSPNIFNLNFSVPRATYIATTVSKFLDTVFKDPSLCSHRMDVHYKETNAYRTIEEVTSGESHFGIIRYPKMYEAHFLNLVLENGLHYESLGEFTMCLLLHKNHPLAYYDTIPYDALSDYTQLLHGDFREFSPTFDISQKNLLASSSPKTLYIYDRSSQFDLLEQVHGAYLWVSPIPTNILEKHQLITRPCTLMPSAVDCAIYPYKDSLSHHAQQLIESLGTTLASLIK